MLNKFFLPTLLILCFSVFAVSQTVSAQDVKGIIVTPKRVVFEQNQRIQEVLIANRGSVPAKYRVTLINRAMTESGNLTDAVTPGEGEFFAKDVLRFGPRQVTLGPKQSQKIRIMSRLKSNSEDGEYKSHLLVQEIPEAAPAESAAGSSSDQVGVSVRAIFGISLPIIVRKGELSAEASLSDAKVIEMEGDKMVQVKINRKGTKSLFGTLKVFTGDTQIGILKNVAVYLSTPHRITSVRINPDHANSLSGKPIRVTYTASEENEDTPSAETAFTAP
jgi:P pilus assembly chaperone PapD